MLKSPDQSGKFLTPFARGKFLTIGIHVEFRDFWKSEEKTYVYNATRRSA